MVRISLQRSDKEFAERGKNLAFTKSILDITFTPFIQDGDKDNAQEKKNLLTLKVYSRELQKCRSLRFSRI